jgi:7-cyano-7-deazaguanine synthase
MSKIVLAFSGGADSSVLLHMAAEKYDEVYCLFFDYGQRHKKELDCAQKQLKNLKKKVEMLVIETPLNVLAPTSSLTNNNIATPDVREMRGEAQPKSYVAFRNMLFISYILSYAEGIGAGTVWYGAAQADSLAGYWDGSLEFLLAVNQLIMLNRKSKISIDAPLLKLSKQAIISKGIELGVVFKDTWTCYSNRPDGLADADTPSSSLRLRGFIESGYRDPIQYVQQDKINKIYEIKGCKSVS